MKARAMPAMPAPTAPMAPAAKPISMCRIVSAAFDGCRRVERQRRVYAALAEEMSGPVHALSLTALTPAEADRMFSLAGGMT